MFWRCGRTRRALVRGRWDAPPPCRARTSSVALAFPKASDPANPEHVLPVGTDEFWIDVVAGERIQRPVVGTAIEAPEARRAEVCEPWTELVPQQPEEPEDKVAVGSGIGHDLDRAQARLVLQKALKDVDGVAQCAWDEEAAEADELVAGEVEIGDSTPRPEVSRVGSCVDRAHGHNEAQPVGRGDVAFAHTAR